MVGGYGASAFGPLERRINRSRRQRRHGRTYAGLAGIRFRLADYFTIRSLESPAPAVLAMPRLDASPLDLRRMRFAGEDGWGAGHVRDPIIRCHHVWRV